MEKKKELVLFHEIYSIHFLCVSYILKKSLENANGITEKEIIKMIQSNAYLDYNYIYDSLLGDDWDERKWPLLERFNYEDLDYIYRSKIGADYNRPLTTLEKRWLKTISNDPRVKLFDINIERLEDSEPLFSLDDYRCFDKYKGGDMFDNQTYIDNFRYVLAAMKSKEIITIQYKNYKGESYYISFKPKYFEYSLKEDKIRIISEKNNFYNMDRIISCVETECTNGYLEKDKDRTKKELIVNVSDERNTVERFLFHFSNFEKKTEEKSDGLCKIRIEYYIEDETELLINILSFGPTVEVVEQECFKELIKDRLERQKKIQSFEKK